MEKTTNRGLARNSALALLAVFFTLASIELPAQQANPETPIFGIGFPVRATELPASPFRARLESLPANTQKTALKWLQSFEFAAEDIESLRIDDQGGIYYADSILPDPPEKPEPVQRVAPVATLNDVFLLHSKPGAPNRVFIDFDGHVIRDSAWNGGQTQYDAVPYDLDGDPTDFNSTERDRMANIWHRVAEDLAPFDIDVTTEEPVVFDQFTGHILVTRSYDAKLNLMPSSGGGGVAYVNVFGNGNYHTWYSPALVYFDHLGSGGETYVAEASSHEFGHNLGLSHDGAPGVSYYGGHGSGLVSWAPIMGNSYNRNVTQWSKGEYTNANQTQDDLAIIATDLPYQPDDHDDVRVTATPLDVDFDGTIQVSNPETDPHNVYAANKGVINDDTDTDFFSFESGTGTVSIDANPAWDAWTRATSRRGANLDVEMELQNSAGTTLVVDEPAPSSGHIDTKATINWTITTAGTYYLAVTGVGNTVTPYSDYDSLGRYFIFGSVPDPNLDNDPPSPSTMTWASPPAAASSSTITMTATTATAEVSVEYNFQCTAGGIMCLDSGWQPGTTHVATGLQAGVQYSYQVIARDQDHNETNPSVVASATPPQDPLGAPYGLTAAPFSPFRIDVEWNDNSSGETSFRVERSPDGATWAEIGNTGAGVETYTDNSVNRYTAYYYRARAFNGSSYSGYSNRWGAATPDTLPLAPGNLLVSPDTATSLELDWDDNSDNETAFKIERSPNGTGSWTEIDTVDPNITTYTDTGLSTFTAYWYRIRSTNTAGNSAYSNIGMSSTGPVPPDPSFTFICDLFLCAFTDTSTDSDGTVESWDWDFGDTTTSTVRSPVHAFPATGLYEVSLTATDDDSNTDTISQFVNILGVTAVTSVDVQISTANDDVEEFITNESSLLGYVWLSSTDLDLIYDTNGSTSGDLVAGLRFNALDIPQGATITNAYIRFTAFGSNSGSSSLSFTAEDIDTAPAFSGNTVNFNLTSRTFTSAAVAWNSMPAWTSGQTYDSPDLSTVVQEVVNRSGWAANNSMVFAVSGTSGGIRRAYSYDNTAANAASLHVEYGSFATACIANRSIQADIWESFSLPCDPGSANKVEDVFGNLVSGGAVYDTDWFVWRYDASSDTYFKMNVDEVMNSGQGYWIYTLVPTTVDFTGTKNQTGDLALTANTTTGLLNYIGHTENADKPWADFKAAYGPTLVTIPGADAWNDPPANTVTECALGPPSVLCLVSRTAYVWKAGNFQTFDAHVPGLNDDVEAGYGIFVRAFRPGAMLRIEDGPAPSPPAPESVVASKDSAGSASGISTRKDKKTRLTDPWMIRLIANAGLLQDRSNVLGQLANSVDGKDSNDIPELEPFGNRYLSLTFENEQLGVSDWGYTSDYRALSAKPSGEWPILIRASADAEEMTLSWDGEPGLFKKAYLRDEQTGETIRVRADASYVFINADGENRFTFIMK